MLVDEPAQAVRGAFADLLVGCRDEDQVAAGLKPLAHERREGDRRGCDVSLHVERPPAPDLAVHDVSGPRIALPFGGIGEHGVRVAEKGEAQTATAAETRNDVCPLRLTRDPVAVDAVVREVVAKHGSRTALVPRRVHGVRANQRLEQRRRFLAEAGLLGDSHYGCAFESAVNSLRTSQSSGNAVFDTSFPRSSTGVP
jgi:hypothetical protein